MTYTPKLLCRKKVIFLWQSHKTTRRCSTQRRRKESRNNSPRLGRVISKTQSYNLIEHIFYRPKVLYYFQRFYLSINLTALPLVLFVSAIPQYLLYKIIREIIHWSVALVCNFPILLLHFELFQIKKSLYK